MKTLKLASLNIGIKVPNTERVIDFLKQQDADFVAIQEMVRHLDDSVLPEYRVRDDVKTSLGKLYPHSFFAPLWVSDAFREGSTINRDFGGYIEQGNELLAKYPIVKGTNEFFYKHFEHIHDWSSWIHEDHGRALQVAEYNVDGTPLQILNLHGIWTPDKRGDERTLKECEYVVAAAMRRNVPTIIGGDFNLLPDTESIGLVDKTFRNLIKECGITSTRPAFKDEIESGGKVVDYVFVNDLVEVKNFAVVDADVSGHLPLMLEFAIKR